MDEAIFFQDANFKGKYLDMRVSGLNDAPTSVFMCNDCISSFKIGPYVKAHLCKNAHCAGDSEWDGAVDIIGPYSINNLEDINDWISHIKISTYSPFGDQFVQAFSLPEFNVGHAGLFPPG